LFAPRAAGGTGAAGSEEDASKQSNAPSALNRAAFAAPAVSRRIIATHARPRLHRSERGVSTASVEIIVISP